MNKTSNDAWSKNYNRTIEANPKVYPVDKYPKRKKVIGKTTDSKSTRQVVNDGMIIEPRDRSNLPPNHCYKIVNEPKASQIINFEGPEWTSDLVLKYNYFMPTGEIYEYLPCLPCPPDSDAAKKLGFREVRRVDTIMKIDGAYMAGTKAFTSYKLLLYSGRSNLNPTSDDKHRFIYLAQKSPGEAGDCFIRLEEVHNRMRGKKDPYFQDCEAAIQNAGIINPRRLRFRCWTVRGAISYDHEQTLFDKLFSGARENEEADHVEVFCAWAEILRRSQGDKLASKEFFGRYWDAVIPDKDLPIFTTGIRIVVSEKYFYDCGYSSLSPIDEKVRDDVRNEVWKAVKRVVEAPRLKFKPTLSVENIIFDHEAKYLLDGGNKGWRSLEPHPGGLYGLLVDIPVRDFLSSSVHKKPLLQPGWTPPTKRLAEKLHELLDKCGRTAPTITFVETQYVAAAGKSKRNPTQDKCVAKKGLSANVAMATAYPILNPAEAKQRRVAEWLHRSAFSYGGIEEGNLNSSQVANNLVLGTPDTNTVMMRYEAFVKRLAYYSIKRNNENGDRVRVDTEITYSTFLNPRREWMRDNSHQYTWLAPELVYKYQNSSTSTPHVSFSKTLYPLNRDGSMLFQALLDRSLESQCWNWKCWDNNAVAKALLESTAMGGDQEGPLDMDTLKYELEQALTGGQGEPLRDDVLEDLVRQSLDPERP